MAVHCRPDPMAAARLVDLLDQSQDIQHFQGTVNTGNTRGGFQAQGFMINILGGERNLGWRQRFPSPAGAVGSLCNHFDEGNFSNGDEVELFECGHRSHLIDNDNHYQ